MSEPSANHNREATPWKDIPPVSESLKDAPPLLLAIFVALLRLVGSILRLLARVIERCAHHVRIAAQPAPIARYPITALSPVAAHFDHIARSRNARLMLLKTPTLPIEPIDEITEAALVPPMAPLLLTGSRLRAASREESPKLDNGKISETLLTVIEDWRMKVKAEACREDPD